MSESGDDHSIEDGTRRNGKPERRSSRTRSWAGLAFGAALLAAAFFGVASPMGAQRTEIAVRAAPRSGPVRVDGVMDEAAWSDAHPARAFVQARPDEGAEPARATRVRILYDDDAIYVGGRMLDGPDAVHAQLVRRDGEGSYDFVQVELDLNGDRRTGYLFQVSAAGAQRDAYLHDDVRVDDSFDAEWASAVSRDSTGWSAELRIPLSQIRYGTDYDARPWGINVVRRRLASNSVSMLVLRSRARTGRVSQYGRLGGVRIEGGGGPVELVPYLASSLRRAPAEAENPFFDGLALGTRAGLDARWKPASNVAVDAAVNPDFGQVEVDPAVVNLSAFETYFPEKRPFFTRNARLFEFGLSGARRTLFHSRRVGRRPLAEGPDDADFVDMPDITSILGAAKATGRTEGGTSLGAMGVLTAEENGRAHFADSGRTEGFVAQPRTGFGVLRLLQDFREGATSVGGIAAGVRRALPGTGAFADVPDTETAAGLDFEHLWGGPRNRRYALWGYVSGSLVTGSRAALTQIQRDPNHYFQRPDAEYKSVDSTATRMLGREWRIQIERRSAEHWTWAAWLNEVSPGYVVDGVGFAGRTLPRIDVGGELAYQEIDPGRWARSWTVLLNTFHNFRHAALDEPVRPSSWEDAHQSGRFLLAGEAVLDNSWRVGLRTRWAPRTLTERETRGGPLMTRPARYALSASVGSAPRRFVGGSADVVVEDRSPGGSRLAANLAVELRPAPGWELSLGPRWERHRDAAQYVTASDAVPHPPTHGSRYVFADLDRQEVGLTVRLDAAFTPDISLQAFAQPLLSSVDFLGYKELARARAFDFIPLEEGLLAPAGGELHCRRGRTCAVGDTRVFDFDEDGVADATASVGDFSLASLRGNAVFRWEYLPGSELFLVWEQKRRRRRAGLGRASLEGLDALLEGRSRSVFLLKVSHRLEI